MTPLNTIIEEEKWISLFTSGLPTIVTEKGITTLHPDFTKALTTAMQRAFEAGEREAHLKNTQDLITIGERIKSGEVTIEQYLERWRSHLDTLLSKIQS